MLSARAAAALKSHLVSCAGCRREKALLALAVEGMSLLAVRRPSAAFDARVLAAAAAARRERVHPRFAVWALDVAATVTVLWTAALAAFARPRLSVSGALSVVHALRHPAAALSVLELRAVEAGLSLPEALRAARHAAAVFSRVHFIPGSVLGVLPIQCMAATLIAGLAVAAAARPRHDPAVSRRIR